MKPDLAPITPAFRKDWQAYAFVGLIFSLVLFPLVSSKLHLISQRDRFLEMTETGGAFEHIAKEIYQRESDIAILVLGGCGITQGINAATLRKKFHEVHPDDQSKDVVVFPRILSGQDIDYFVLRELLRRRRVDLVVYQTPVTGFDYNLPNISAVIWNMDRDPDMTAQVPVIDRFRIYAQSVLGSLRDVLSLIRANPLAKFDVKGEGEKESGNIRKNSVSMGRDRQSDLARNDPNFVEFIAPRPSVSVEELFFETNPNGFLFNKIPLPQYQYHYLKKTIELLKEKHIPVIVLNVPTNRKNQPDKVCERIDWSSIAGGYAHLMGISRLRLCPGLTAKQIGLLYYDDDHFNANGSALFTDTIFRGLMHVYDETRLKSHK